MHTYLFYDLETSGLNKCFDQVMQFAAIRTDLAFNEIERYNFVVRLNPDVVPSPRALLTHRLSPDDCAQGKSEFTAIGEIHRLLNTQGTISLGYNTLRFDDEFLRFSFFRNLLSPYTHQYANQCRRMDIFPMAVMYRLFKPEVLKWPTIDGKGSMKLEAINEANQFVQGEAHDALVDVEVTLKLAQALYADKEMWSYISAFFNKHEDMARISQLPEVMRIDNKPLRYGVLIESKLGDANGYSAPVLYLGEHAQFKQQLLLRLDLEELAQVSIDSIDEHSWVIRKKLGEPGFMLPPKDRYQNQVVTKRKQIVERNLGWCNDNPALLQEIINHYRHYTYPEVENLDADAALYDNGFWSDHDNLWCMRFQAANDDELQTWLHEVTNPLLYQLGLRVIARHKPALLNEEQQLEVANYLQAICEEDGSEKLRDFQNNPRLSPQQVLTEINELKLNKELDEASQKLLSQLELYIKECFDCHLGTAIC